MSRGEQASMIQTIVFDLGNVLIDFQPEKFLRAKGMNETEVQFLLREVYQSEEWVFLDLGKIRRKEALDRIIRRNPDKRVLLESSFFIDEVLTPIEDNITLFKQIDRKRYRTVFLSNYHQEAFKRALADYDFFSSFSGGVVSYEVGMVKPDPEIYRHLLVKYQLNPEQTLFIDDSEVNIQAAIELGFTTIHLKRSGDLGNQLISLGILK